MRLVIRGSSVSSPLLDPAQVEAHQRSNFVHSILLIGGIALVLAAGAYLLFGAGGIVAAFVSVGVLSLIAPQIPPEMVMRLYRGKLQPPGHDQLSRIIDELSARAELPARPDFYVIPSATLNAFATGNPKHSAIAVTEGLLRRLTMREIIGVIGHEMSHIRNNDLWLMNVADVMTRYVQVMSYVALYFAITNLLALTTGDMTVSWFGIALLYLAPALSSLLQLALSRTREFDADREGAMLTGDPLGLASALSRLDNSTGHFWEDLAFPVPARRTPQPSLLRSHPLTEERVSRLRNLVPQERMPQLGIVEEPMVSLIGCGPIEMRPRYRWPGVWF